MNAVGIRERSKTARHEATHGAVMLMLGVTPLEVRILPPPRDGGGYCQGTCSVPRGTGRGTHGAMLAAGVLDGHGAQADELALLELFPDEHDRESMLQIAARLMALGEFGLLANRIARRLRFRDVMYPQELKRIAQDVRTVHVGR